MNKKRLIITSVISILLVALLLVGSSYAVFTTGEEDDTLNVYKTGTLDITYTLSDNNISFTDIIPKTEEEADGIKPYRITVTNSGNVAYMFDLVLQDTTSTDSIYYDYIMTKVGYLESKSLSLCENNVIKKDIIIMPNTSVDIDVRVWISDSISNSEIGKSFYAKLMIDGEAVYTNNEEVDNDILSLNYIPALFPYTFEEVLANQSMQGIVGLGTMGEFQNIYFVDYIDFSNANDEEFIQPLNEDESIMIWTESNSDLGVDLYIGSKYKVYAEDLRWFFGNGGDTLLNVDFSNLDTSLTKDMTGMFGLCTNLTTLDLSSFDTGNVTNMVGMFAYCFSFIFVYNFAKAIYHMNYVFCDSV